MRGILSVAVAALTAGLTTGVHGPLAPDIHKPRVVITTDPELDDSNSLIRYLLYSTDFRTEGIIYASSQFHWKGDGTGKKWSVPNREYFRFGLNLCPCESWRWAPGERFIDDDIDIYERVYPNLRVHHADYPTPAELRSKIRWGNVDFDGDISKDTPGSNLIRDLLLDDKDPEPIYLLAWGGASTIARALKSIQERHEGTADWPALRARVSRKAILSLSGDQDDTYANYIHPNWPDIRSLAAGQGGVGVGYGAFVFASAENAPYYSVDWTRANISSRGPFGEHYRVWGDGKQMVRGDRFDYFGLSGLTTAELRAKGYVVWLPPRPKGEFLGEGDTFTYFNLIDNGLDAYRDETAGGWAGHVAVNPGSSGRTGQSAPAMSFEAFMKSLEGIGPEGPATRPPSPQPNFTAAAQNDFATRMKWSVTPSYSGANHEPTVTIRGSSQISAQPGATVRLEGTASDPDGNTLTVRWWRWKDVDTYPGDVTLSNPTALTTTLRVPDDAKPGQTIQLVLEATDNGTPALTRYRRAIILVGTTTAQSPRVELDHMYIVVQPGGVKEIAALKSAGFFIVPPQKHDGEGITSVAAMFDNAYLELMWLDSTLSVTPDHAAAAQQFRDAAAWRVNRHSPFGIGLRRLPAETAEFPFPIKRESAPWIDAQAAYEILNQPADSLAVDVFVVPYGAAVPNWIERLRQRFPERLNHPGGGREITAVRVYGTIEQQPSTFTLVRPARIEMRTGSEPLLEIYIDGGVKNSRTDLRPVLPLVVIR